MTQQATFRYLSYTIENSMSKKCSGNIAQFEQDLPRMDEAMDFILSTP